MKMFLWALTVITVSLSLTACGDSPEKFVNDVVESGIKCETHEYNKTKCDQLVAEFRSRNRNFSEEEQNEIRKQVVERFYLELKKLDVKNVKVGSAL